MASKLISLYYQILDIDQGASLEEIKRQYRIKAKNFHPDRNGSPDAHEQFVFLTEAYEFLVALKSNGTKVSTSDVFVDWEAVHRGKARQKASDYAKMRYEEFKKTPYYKNTQAVYTILQHLYFFSCVIILLCPLWGFIIHKWFGFGIGLLFTFLSVQYWADFFRKKQELNFKMLTTSITLIFKTRVFKIVIAILINLYLFFRITLNTELSFMIMMIGLGGLYLLAFVIYLINRRSLTNTPGAMVLMGLVPSVFNVVFLINSLFSTNPMFEEYTFVHEREYFSHNRRNGTYEKVSRIILENDAYAENEWFLVFYDFEAMKNKRVIRYKFEDGLLGMRVLKKYKFIR